MRRSSCIKTGSWCFAQPFVRAAAKRFASANAHYQDASSAAFLTFVLHTFKLIAHATRRSLRLTLQAQTTSINVFNESEFKMKFGTHKLVQNSEQRDVRWRPVGKLLACVAMATAMLSGCGTLADWRDENKGIQMDALKTPPGLTVTLFATALPKAREMALSPGGTLFVGSNAGNVYALTLSGNQIKKQRTIITGIIDPSGIAFKDGALYVSARTKVLRYDDIENRLDNPPAPITVIDGFPDKQRHGAHYMAFGPDQKLYVSVGSPCDLCEAQNDEHGTIIRVNPDGSGKEVVARGIRNTVGFDWHPQTKELWFTEQGQDNLGTELPTDKLNRLTKLGENFGFPYCHDGNIANPEYGGKRA